MSVRVTTTVLKAATSYDLIDLATIKDELEIAGGAYDTRLKRYITAASAAAANYCNRVFLKETLSDQFDISVARLQFGGEAQLQLSRYPAISIASVTENAVALVQDTDYRVDLKPGLLWRLNTSALVTTWCLTPVVIQYDGGFAAIPSDLSDAVTRMIRSRWFAKGRDPLVRQRTVPGVLEEQFWVPTGTDAGNMTPDVADILDNYRTITIA